MIRDGRRAERFLPGGWAGGDGSLDAEPVPTSPVEARRASWRAASRRWYERHGDEKRAAERARYLARRSDG